MCQTCVDDGFMTQEQLDQRILNGDLNVMPLMDLGPDDALIVSANVVRSLIKRGMPREDALECGALMLAVYYAETGQTPS
jgi:hypothetical protein